MPISVYRFQPLSNLSFLHTFLFWKPWLPFLMSLGWFLCFNFIHKMSFPNPPLSDITGWLPFCLIYFPDFRPWCWERPYSNSLLLSFVCLEQVFLIHSSVPGQFGLLIVWTIVNIGCSGECWGAVSFRMEVPLHRGPGMGCLMIWML